MERPSTLQHIVNRLAINRDGTQNALGRGLSLYPHISTRFRYDAVAVMLVKNPYITGWPCCRANKQRMAAYAKINANGQWIERSEHISLNELFDRMTPQEMERYAATGTVPTWFERTLGATPTNSQGASNVQ
jgi:hypothetical protein